MKILSGAMLTGLSLLAEVLTEWLKHFFFAVFYIGLGARLQAGGGFATPAPYSMPETVQIFIGTRILIWLLIVLGILLIVWGIRERAGTGA